MAFFYLLTSFCLAFSIIQLGGCTDGGSAPSSEAASASDSSTSPLNTGTLDPKVDAALQPYFDEFKAFLSANTLVVPPDRMQGIKEIRVDFPTNTHDGKLALNVVGRCYETKRTKESGTVEIDARIVISPQLEELLKLDSNEQPAVKLMTRYTLFHEGGHCIGGLKHRDEARPRLNMPLAIMDAYVPNAEVLEDLPWDDLLKEFAQTWREESR